MINSLEIRNFRCFERLRIDDCRRINLIVGDNGAGKTALLEAIFLALGTTPDLAVRFRQTRGLEGSFAGPVARIEEALWRDLFYKGEWDREISVSLRGSGQEARSLTVSRIQPQLTISFDEKGQERETRSAPISFVWQDSNGKKHERLPRMTRQGLQVEGSEEDLPDFFYFPANQTISSVENAMRFSEISRAGNLKKFIGVFTREYNWIEDLNIEVVAGAPIIYATLRHSGDKFPLPNVSGGINRVVSIMLAIASRKHSVVAVDEIEDGLYFKHHAAIGRGLISLAKSYDAQLFLTTHNEEWLEGLAEAAGTSLPELALWRVERAPQQPIVRQFSGETFKAGIDSGGEVR